MTSIAGIIYPDMIQATDLIDPMLDTLKLNSSQLSNSCNYKNFQIGCVGKNISKNPEKTIFLILDGSIDNCQILAKELKLPASFSQEEIVIAAYEKLGIAALDKIYGSFAMAILDQAKNTLYLMRDRIGKKPLYWYRDRHYFVFASEIKSLLASGVVPQTPSPDALSAYLYLGFIPQDLTPIKDVSKLLPAHYLRIIPHHGHSIVPYWSYSSYFEPFSLSKQQITEDIDLLLTRTVQDGLEGSNSVGCFVSGGLGSASVAYYVSKELKGAAFPAFNAGFQGQNEEDIVAAKSVAKSLNLPFNSSKITTQNFLKDLVKIAWCLDEPLADSNVVATWNLCKLAASEVTTVFSGMGSDELFAGHSRYSIAERDTGHINRLLLLPKPLLQKILIPLLKVFFTPAAYNLLKVSRTNPWQFEYLRDNALFDEKELAEASPHLAGMFDPDTFLHKFYHLNRISSTVSSFLYFDVKTRLPDWYIFQYNRLTHVHGLSWKTPFLDRRFVEYAAHLPEPEMLEESETASYLKPLIQHVFTPDFFNRPKKTRKYFLSNWMQDERIFETMQLLKKGTLVETGFISEKWLKEQLSDPNKASISFRYLFAILMLEIWFRLFINRPVHVQPPALSVAELLSEP